MADLDLAYAQGCMSILLQQDKDIDVRVLGLKLMAAADKKRQPVSDAFSRGRVDTAVFLSKRRRKVLKK